MCTKSDEQILYESYMRLREINTRKVPPVSLEDDKKTLAGIMAKFPIIFMRLEQDNTLTAMDVQQSLFKAKSYIVQLNKIKVRNPSLIKDNLVKTMDSMVKAMCKREADMINLLRLQETGGDRIDLETIFQKPLNVSSLGNMIARDIIKKAMKDEGTYVGEKTEDNQWYITETGKKYHVKDCVYCKGKTLVRTTNSMIDNQKLEPCKCVERLLMAEDRTYVTAFIDESIHRIKWNEEGKADSTSSFSYIICWGNLLSEKNIREDNIITKGVDYYNETDSVSKVTEAAIGKVMLSLIYDYNFTGTLQIYTDNKVAMKSWSQASVNSLIAKHFKSVSVSYIPRERNTEADKLGREKMYLCLATDVYNSIVSKCNDYDNLKRKYEQEVVGRKRIEDEIEQIKNEKQNTLWNRFTKWINKKRSILSFE